MATSTRRRKPAAPDAPVLDTLTPDTAAVAPPSDAAASPEPAAEPPKRPRAPRKTPAARKRAVAAAAPAEAGVAAPADEAMSDAPAAVEPPADTAAGTPAEAPAPRAPRPRRKREAAAAAEPALEAPAAEAVAHGVGAAAASDEPAPASNDEAIDEPAPPPPAAEDVSETAEPPEPTPAPAPPPLPPTSRLRIEDDGLQRRLRWQTGARCPDTLGQALRRWQLAGFDGPLPLTQVDDLAELLAIAARTGHEVEVEPAVWAHLARLGDLQGRIAHLESRHPQGLDPAAQPEGSLLAGWRPCQLEAAFFAACVGRCVLADEPALQPEAELLLAARLVMQHFGAEALVVQAPAETHASWHTARQAAWAPGGATEAPGPQPALRLLTPDQDAPTGTELLLLDQRAGVAPTQAETPAAQAAPWLWVLAPADLLGQPGALPLLAAVDQLRQGGLAAWQRDGDAEALAPLVLARRFDDVAAQWPAWQPAERSTPAPAGEGVHQAELAQRLARWQRSGFLADSDQLALRHALQAAWDSARATNAAALPALLREALAAGAGRIVVFSEDAATLPALADALRAEGLPADALPATGAPRQVDQALRAFRDTAEPCILLAADGPGGDGPRIGVQLAAPLVVHLDTPWAAGTLDRRLQRVRPGAAQREVPVWQLLPEGSLMARRARVQPVAEAAPATAPITSLTGALLRGPALATWQAELAAVAAPMTQPDAPT